MNPALEKRLLFALFLLAMIRGSGPGLYLVNPDISAPNPSFTTFGLPTIYVWGLFWYAVQLGVSLRAYFYHWKDDDDA